MAPAAATTITITTATRAARPHTEPLHQEPRNDERHQTRCRCQRQAQGEGSISEADGPARRPRARSPRARTPTTPRGVAPTVVPEQRARPAGGGGPETTAIHPFVLHSGCASTRSGEAGQMGSEDHDGRILADAGTGRPPGLPGDLVEAHHLRTQGRLPLGEELRVAEVDRRVERELGRELRSDPPHHRHGPEVPLPALCFVNHDDRGAVRVGEVPAERVELCEGIGHSLHGFLVRQVSQANVTEKSQRQDRDDGDHDGGHAPEPPAHPDDRSHETERAEDRDRQREGQGAWQRHRATGGEASAATAGTRAQGTRSQAARRRDSSFGPAASHAPPTTAAAAAAGRRYPGSCADRCRSTEPRERPIGARGIPGVPSRSAPIPRPVPTATVVPTRPDAVSASARPCRRSRSDAGRDASASIPRSTVNRSANCQCTSHDARSAAAPSARPAAAAGGAERAGGGHQQQRLDQELVQVAVRGEGHVDGGAGRHAGEGDPPSGHTRDRAGERRGRQRDGGRGDGREDVREIADIGAGDGRQGGEHERQPRTIRVGVQRL